MKERRSLVNGLDPSNPVARSVEEQFVFDGKSNAEQATQAQAPPAETREGKGQTANPVARVPMTTRIRADFALALKRASLQRQLNGVFPNTLQDILEDAVDPWLRSNGYLN